MVSLANSTSTRHAASALLFVLAATHSAMACSPAIYFGTGAIYDRPISVAADCSFQDPYVERFGFEHSRDTRSGGPAVDIGNGRIAQKIVSSEICFPTEMLLFVDCKSGQAALIVGAPPPEAEGSSLGGVYIKYIQAPLGPIRLDPQTSVDAVIATALSNDLEIIEDAQTFLQGTRKRDRYDVTCGCDRYYPQSVGATD